MIRALRRFVAVVSWSLFTKVLVMLVGSLLLLGAVLVATSINSTGTVLRSEVQSRFALAASGRMQSAADLLMRELVWLTGVAADPLIVETGERFSAEQSELDIVTVESVNAAWRYTQDSEAQVQSVIDPELNPVTARLWRHMAAGTDIVDLMVVDSLGAVVAATSRPDDYHYSFASWWGRVHNHGQGGLHIAGGYTAAEAGPYLEIAVPIWVAEDVPDAGGRLQFGGAVRGRIDPGALVRAMTMTPLRPLQEALITDAQGNVLVRTSVHPVDRDQVPESWIGHEYALNERRQTHEAVMADGTPVLLGHSSMQQLGLQGRDSAPSGWDMFRELDWLLFVYQPTRSAYAEIAGVESRILGIGLTTLIAMLAGSYVWSRSAVAPFEQLTSFARTHIVPWAGDADGSASQGGEPSLPPPLTVEVLQHGHGAERAWIYPQPEAGTLALALNRLMEEQATLLDVLRARDEGQEREQQRRRRDAILIASIGDLVSVANDVAFLTQRVVSLIRDHYNLYFVGFYLADTFEAGGAPHSGGAAHSGGRKRWAVLHAGTGDAGRALLARGHRVTIQSPNSTGGQQPELVGACLATGALQVARDLGAGRRRSDSDVLPYARSEIVVPLRSRGRVLGAITALSYQSDTFDEATMQVFQMIADRVAVAIDSIRLYADSQVATERLQRAYGELSREAWREAVGGRVGRGYEALVTGVRPLTPLAPDSWPSDVRDAWRGTEVPIGGAASALTSAGAAVGSPGTAPPASRSSQEFRLALPIRVRGGADDLDTHASDVIGVLDVSKRIGEGDWTPGEVDQLRALAVQLGQALENARLYEMTQQNALEEQMVGDITRRLRETLSVDTVLQTAVRELQSLLHLNEVEVRMGRGSVDSASAPLQPLAESEPGHDHGWSGEE